MNTAVNPISGEELLQIHNRAAADEAQRLRIGADNLDERMRDLAAAGMRAVFDAGVAEGIRQATSENKKRDRT